MSSVGSFDPLQPQRTDVVALTEAQASSLPKGVPQVSVVIPTYNSATMVVQAVESVLSQTYHDFEILVVDDGSTDNTQQAIGRFGDLVRYFKQKNQGVSAARNAGIKQARGEYIAFLDSDDIWLPDKLAEQVPWLNTDPNVGLVYCDWSVVSNGCVAHSSFLRHLPANSGDVFDDLIQSGFILTSGVVVRRACLDDVGDFDKSLTIAQDYDLWLRISYRWQVQLVSKCLFTKRNLAGSLSSSLSKTALERIALFKKTLRSLPGLKARSRRLLRRQLAVNYWDVGYENFDGLSLENARKNFISSLMYDWTNIKSLAYLAATFFPVSVVRAARTIKRSSHAS